jgi:site-specific DNA-methyltransferase (adenine-specific)
VLSSNGRFPANLILTHHPECECVGTKKVKGSKDGVRKASSEFGQNSGWNDHQNKDTIRKGISDENGEETIEDWNCHEDCPIKILDKQSGESKSSRFFYIAKASKSERNKGLKAFEEKNSASAEFRPNHLEKAQNGESGNPYGRWSQIKNFHPTVKPIKLMQYLVRLVTPPNGKVLDPFCGSGTTGVACKLEEFDFVGLEQDAEYCKIAQARIDNYIKDDKVSKSEKKESFDNDTQLNLF